LIHQAAVEAPPGRTIMSADFRELDIPHSHFAVALRFHLQEVLLASARDQGAEVVFGQRCNGVTTTGERVQLLFENDGPAEVDLVFACDGIRSAVREAAGFQSRSRPVGEAYLRLVAPMAHPNPDRIGEYWANDGRRAGAFPLPENRTYVFCSVPLGQWQDIRANRLGEWVESWRDFGSPVYPLMRSVEDWNRAVYDELSDLRVDRWYDKRIILLGDAAHAMTPNLGQGANSAMVDGLVLVNLLVETSVTGDWRSAARRYEQLRKPFVRRLQRAALMGGRIASWTSKYARGMRDGTLRFLDHVGPIRRTSMKIAAGYNPAEEPYLHPPVRLS
jgi:2-polyprenyl-6-methoxyphenol hydroxylase-like FAD-dependent oxidoreductase